jgi:alcohol dehydrogenase class IV
MEFNYAGLESRFDKMAEFLGVVDGDGARVVDFLFELNQRLELPTKLSEIGVRPEHIEELSNLAVADFAHPNNPKPVSWDDFHTLYQKAL